MSETSRSIALALWGEHVVLHLILNAYWEGSTSRSRRWRPAWPAGGGSSTRPSSQPGRHPGRGRARRRSTPVPIERGRARSSCWRRRGRRPDPQRRHEDDDNERRADRGRAAAGWRDPGRLEEGLDTASPWYQWGPYVSERAWGSVREDYSADGDAWASFPHDHARSRAYRWNEDGMAGLSDVFGRLNLGLALWNGRDPILKERMFGLTNSEGNHGEDVKEYWWYLDATPSSAWLRWRYHYPQAAFPYEDLVAENGRRSRARAGVRAARHRHLRRRPVLDRRGRLREGRPDRHPRRGSPSATPARTPRRSTSCRRCGSATSGRGMRSIPRPSLSAEGGAGPIRASHPALGDYELHVGAGPDGAAPELLFCENETNAPRVYGAEATTAWPKDGINDHVVNGAATVNPAQTGTKAAAWYRLTVAPGATAEIRLRLRPRPPAARGEPRRDEPPGRVVRRDRWPLRKAEADEFYADLVRPAPPTTRRWSCARRSPGCCGASSSTPTTSAAGSTATRPARRRRRSG